MLPSTHTRTLSTIFFFIRHDNRGKVKLARRGEGGGSLISTGESEANNVQSIESTNRLDCLTFSIINFVRMRMFRIIMRARNGDRVVVIAPSLV